MDRARRRWPISHPAGSSSSSPLIAACSPMILWPHAAELGLDAIIVDHHQAGETLPAATAVINPNRHDDLSGMGYLCACGVAMILIAAVNRLLRQRGWYGAGRPEPNMLQWLELVALATVCDVVPLKGLNRAYVTQGLKIMARRENPGLAALADVARLKRRPDAYALAFCWDPASMRRAVSAMPISHSNCCSPPSAAAPPRSPRNSRRSIASANQSRLPSSRAHTRRRRPRLATNVAYRCSSRRAKAGIRACLVLLPRV